METLPAKIAPSRTLLFWKTVRKNCGALSSFAFDKNAVIAKKKIFFLKAAVRQKNKRENLYFQPPYISAGLNDFGPII